MTLTARQLDEYQRDGVLHPLPALDVSEVAHFRRGAEELANWFEGEKPAISGQAHLFHRWAYDLAVHPRIVDTVAAILGDDILVHSTSLFFKRARTADFVSWHQDGFYWKLDEPRLVSAWIALTDSATDNGCLRVVPASHIQRMEHRSAPMRENDLLASGLEIAVDVDDRDARDIVLAPGEMSLHHVLIVHGSNANLSIRPRIGFAVRYVAAGVRQEREHHEVMLARGRNVNGHYRVIEGPPVIDGDPFARQAAFNRERVTRLLGPLSSEVVKKSGDEGRFVIQSRRSREARSDGTAEDGEGTQDARSQPEPA
jgi:non-haem Fe2+, alpha-ketoglutarate-dependent halogenase